MTTFGAIVRILIRTPGVLGATLRFFDRLYQAVRGFGRAVRMLLPKYFGLSRWLPYGFRRSVETAELRKAGVVIKDHKVYYQELPPGVYEEQRSEERRVGKECRSRWSP